MSHLPHQPFLVVVSAPSGTGKTTVCRRALDDLGEQIRFSISHTTRPRRLSEVDRQDYYFVEAAEFQRMVQAGAFLEWADVYGNWYGTSVAEIERAGAEGMDLLVEIDVQGARQIMARVPDAVSVFVLPPSLAEMERRLRARGTDGDEAVARRLAASRDELREAGRYDYWIINDELPRAVDDLKAIVRSERLRRTRLHTAGHALRDVLRTVPG